MRGSTLNTLSDWWQAHKQNNNRQNYRGHMERSLEETSLFTHTAHAHTQCVNINTFYNFLELLTFQVMYWSLLRLMLCKDKTSKSTTIFYSFSSLLSTVLAYFFFYHPSPVLAPPFISSVLTHSPSSAPHPSAVLQKLLKLSDSLLAQCQYICLLSAPGFKWNVSPNIHIGSPHTHTQTSTDPFIRQHCTDLSF